MGEEHWTARLGFTPIASRDSAGFIAVNWPENAPSTTAVSRELLLSMVDEINRLRAAGDALLEVALDLRDGRGRGAGTVQRTFDAWLEARRASTAHQPASGRSCT